MKTVVAISMLLLALSLCNLMGRRSANNSNRRDAGTVAQSSPAENSNTAEAERPELTTGAGAPPRSAPGFRTLNQNAASEPPPPPTSKPTPPRAPISGGVLNGKATKLVQPPYPAIARAAHASGQVTVQVLIDEEGNVISAHAVSGHPLLQAAAIAAARASKFTPTKLSGQSVKASGVVIYHFVEQ